MEKAKIILSHSVHEFKRPSLYINSFFIGLIVNYFSNHDPFFSFVPYLVPLIVQVFSRCSTAYANRHSTMLSLLPKEREDPVFIANMDGEILLSSGKTKVLLELHQIKTVKDFFGKEGAGKILKQIESSKTNSEPIQCFSPKTLRWYKVKLKVANPDGKDEAVLIWLTDFMAEKQLHDRLSQILEFNQFALAKLQQFTSDDILLQQLGRLILQVGYQAVFVTRKHRDGNLRGFVFKQEKDVISHSEEIIIDQNSQAPILYSRKNKNPIVAESKSCMSQAEFEEKYPFDQRVKEFLGFPIQDFVNYHESEFSIIAFNHPTEERSGENLFLNTLVCNSRMILHLMDMALENEEQFLQKVMGLCSAAEYSDEITGKHILRINEYCKLIAKELGQDSFFIRTIGQVAALHDIGKVAIQELIKFTGRYSAEQRQMVQMHTIYGAQIIQTMMNYAHKEDLKLKMAYNIALNHHQSWNGQGYPALKDESGTILTPTSKNHEDYGNLVPLSGDEIPIEALICALADIYDALRSKRQYKEGFSHEQAYALLEVDDRSGIRGEERFGPQIWGVFLRCHKQFSEIFESMKD